MNLVYDGYNFTQIKEALGPRPGGYRVDPNYMREDTHYRKPYFWDAYRKKWELVSIGDSFFYDDEGIPRKTGMRKSGSKTW